MRTRSLTVAVTTVTAALVALLGACGGEAGGDEPTPTPSRSTEPSGSPGTPVTPSPPATVPTLPSRPPVPPPPPTDQPGETTTLTGEVFAGVEPNCKLLRTDSGDYLLFGEPAEAVRLGSTVTVRGQARLDMATTCQQGTPFEVSEIVD